MVTKGPKRDHPSLAGAEDQEGDRSWERTEEQEGGTGRGRGGGWLRGWGRLRLRRGLGSDCTQAWSEDFLKGWGGEWGWKGTTSGPPQLGRRLQPLSERWGATSSYLCPPLIKPFSIPIYQAEEETTEPPPDPVNIRVSWRLSQVFSFLVRHDQGLDDWLRISFRLTTQLAWITLSLTTTTSLTTRAHIQGCRLSVNSELILFRTLGRPFAAQLQIDISSDAVPCDPEFRWADKIFWKP